MGGVSVVGGGSVSGGGMTVSTVKAATAGVLRLPAASIAVISRRQRPSASAGSTQGEVHGTTVASVASPNSFRHSNVASASDVNSTVAVELGCGSVGAAVMETVGATVSTVKERSAGVGSVPLASMAWTRNV